MQTTPFKVDCLFLAEGWKCHIQVFHINFPFSVYRSTEGIPVSPLRPYHVAEYVDRFDELQRNLGLSLTKSPP